MADLRLENLDGEFLVLSLPTGETHRLIVDDALRRAVRREVISTDDSNIISPREIQLEVRAGVTIEAIVAKTGASAEYVTKFAAPVIDELAHVVKSALSVRITMAGDRYSETTQVEFGEVIANRLAGQGVVTYDWSARKSDNGGWQLSCKYEGQQAVWAFDSRKLALSPENELAVGLSSQQSLTDGPVPRLRSVIDSPAVESTGNTATLIAPAPAIAPAAAIAPAQEASVEPTPAAASVDVPIIAEPTLAAVEEYTTPVKLAPVTPIWEQPVQESQLSKPRQPAQNDRPAPVANITADLGQTVEFDGVVTFGRATTLDSDAVDSGAGLANTADLLDALRRRRLEREQDVLNTNTGAINLVDLSQVSVNDDFDGIDEPAPDTTPVDVVLQDSEDEQVEAEKPKKAARPSMPSWDEIVFNTRSDD